MVNESTNNTAIFAHYDKDCIIDDYVLFYLKELKNVADRIIFVSDCELDEEQISKLKGIVDYTLAQKHGEYDFGSYKRGIQLAMENGLYENTDNLILLNDSCYGPFGSLKNLFEEMNILEHVNEVSNYLEEQLDKLVEQYDNVVARRGKGLMQGLVLTTPVIDTVNKAIEKGLLVISAGSDVLRMVPPLVITKENVDEMIEILSQCL